MTSLAGLAIAVLALGVVGVALFVSPAEPREARYARVAVADGRYDVASEAIACWLRAAPLNSEAHLLKGRVAVAMNRLPEAADELRQAHSLGQPSADLALLRALIASKAGRSIEAQPTLSQVFAEHGQPDRQLYEALAKGYLETYDLTRAAAVLDRWAGDFPDDPKPYLWWAEIHRRTGGDPRAVEVDYRQALHRDPSLASARLGLANELCKAHRNTEAGKEYETYLETKPDDAAAQLGAGRNLMEQGDEAAATEHLRRAMALDRKNAEPLKALADAALRRGDCTAALALIDQAIALDAFDVAARRTRGLVLMRLGRTEDARAEKDIANRLRKDLDMLHAARARLVDSPHDLPSQLVVARWMFDHAHDEEGARWAKKVFAERPDEPEASRLLADYHHRRGETGLANFYRLHAGKGAEPSTMAEERRGP